MRHIDIFCRVQAVEIGVLDARSDVNIEFWILDPVVQAEAIRCADEFVGIAEKAIEL